MRILVSGGAGFVGSHTCVALAERGYEVVVLDNFVNSFACSLDRVARITKTSISVLKCDIRDFERVKALLVDQEIEAVIHFAALKAVGESSSRPLEYFDNNVAGSVSLLRAMRVAEVHKLVFSSSATVYGEGADMPVREGAHLSATNPYGRTKLMVEQVIEDLSRSDPDFGAILLRYFNPVGAHESGLIGEHPVGVPNNLMPYIAQTAMGKREFLKVFGGDWPTRDGTGVRDYIHVMDVADAHVSALDALAKGHKGATPVNVGTGRGTSVLELIHAFKEASGRAIPYEVTNRRPGDISELWADPTFAFEFLGWKARRCVKTMCEDAWRWQMGNPNGYE